MDISITGAKIFFTIPIFGGIPITETLVNTWLIMAAITGLCIWLTRDLKVHATSKKQIVAEFLVKAAYGLVEGNMGKRFRHFTPFIATLISFLALSNLSSMLGLYAPTAELSTELAFAILVFILITYYKFKAGGPLGYVKGFLEPIPILLPFNIISEFATPVSMSFRHYGNVLSGTVISALVATGLQGLSHMLLSWIPGKLGEFPLFQIGLPAVLSLYFDIFSGCMQAFIFAMLTMMYVSGGFPAEEYEKRKIKKQKNVKIN